MYLTIVGSINNTNPELKLFRVLSTFFAAFLFQAAFHADATFCVLPVNNG
jgi:hypothetical protein